MEMSDALPKKPKRSFVEAWLDDERYKYWIHKVSSNEALYHCTVCNKDFSCNAAHVSRHADSVCHRNNLKENLSLSTDDERTVQNKTPSKPVFKNEWLDIEEFKIWLRDVSLDQTLCSCIICDKSFAARLSHIRRHAYSRGHLNICKEKGIETSESNDEVNVQANESLLLFDDRKKAAEIQYAALIAERNIPLQIAQEILTFFQQIGQEPSVLKNMNVIPSNCVTMAKDVIMDNVVIVDDVVIDNEGSNE